MLDVDALLINRGGVSTGLIMYIDGDRFVAMWLSAANLADASI